MTNWAARHQLQLEAEAADKRVEDELIKFSALEAEAENTRRNIEHIWKEIADIEAVLALKKEELEAAATKLIEDN